MLARLGREDATVPALRGAESTADMAALLLRDLPPRFALGGFSLGGLVAMRIAADAPERVTRLALIDTTARPDPEPNWTARRNAVSRARALGVERYVTEKLWSLYVSGDSRADEAHRALVGSMSAGLGLDVFRQQSEMAISRGDNRPGLRAVRAPTLVLCGAEDRLCPVALHEEMAALVPGATLAVIPQAGHFALIEQPDRVAEAMARWLAAPTKPETSTC